MAKILITGGAGFIGSHVVDLFISHGYTINHSSGIYNLGWGRLTSINEIFTNLAEITNYTQPAAHRPAKAGETCHIYLNADKAKKDLGWSLTISLEDGLRETVEYFKTSERVI